MVIVDPNVFAKTERLLLRPLKLDDAEDVLLMRKDAEVMKHTPILPNDDLEKTKEWIQGCHDRENCWNFAVELLQYGKADSVFDHNTTHDHETSNAPTQPSHERSAPRVIGLIGAVRAPEVGYMFNADYWGRGYATEALRAFMPLFFEHYAGGEHERFEFAQALTDPELKSSQNVLKKAGFKFCEFREQDFENPVLGWRDTLVFRMDRPVITV